MAILIKSGHRKTAISRVILKPGTGKITINGKEFKDYFKSFYLYYRVLEPLKVIGGEKQFDCTIRVEGGGLSSQADAVKDSIARALNEYNISFRPSLKSNGLLTRDARIKERKKAGLKKARKGRQYRKR